MLRVYDNEQKQWVKDDIYLNTNDELFLIKKSLFGMTKIPLDSDTYVWHKDIDLYDKNNVLVYEGDYIKAKVSDDKEVIGMVAYAFDLSGYVILCVDSDEFYTLGNSVSSLIEVVGNVFDDVKGKKDGKSN